jgi:hypothetical protein
MIALEYRNRKKTPILKIQLYYIEKFLRYYNEKNPGVTRRSKNSLIN